MVTENIRFNAQVYIEFVHIEGTPVLHMIYDATHFSAALFGDPLTTESVWETILTLCIAANTGMSTTIVFDDAQSLEIYFYINLRGP